MIAPNHALILPRHCGLYSHAPSVIALPHHIEQRNCIGPPFSRQQRDRLPPATPVQLVPAPADAIAPSPHHTITSAQTNREGGWRSPHPSPESQPQQPQSQAISGDRYRLGGQDPANRRQI
ncbi:MAG: hypothetical protein WCD18_12525 [Thermosynechococcaceae cyanobacterium]